MALRYKLGGIESGENAQIARGQRLHALSRLLPRVSAGASENVSQLDVATLGLKNVPVIPRVIGPYWNPEVNSPDEVGILIRGRAWRTRVRLFPRLECDSFQGASFSLCLLFFSIPRWCVRFEGVNETGRDLGYFVDSSQERGLICSRGFVKTADFPHELKRGILDLFGGNGGIKVEKCLDVPAHSWDLS